MFHYCDNNFYVSNNRSWDDKNVALHVLVLDQLHEHVHILKLLSSIQADAAGTAVGTADCQVDADKMGEKVVAYKL